MSTQQPLFAPDEDELRRRVESLMGRAAVLFMEAGEERNEETRAAMEKEAARLGEEAAGIVPVEKRRAWR